MEKQNVLYEIIKSLTPSEKASFKKYGFKRGLKTNEMYFDLFDTIDRLKVYDEKVLKKNIKHKKLLTNFSASKSYLQESLLEFLASNAKNNSLIELYTLLQKAYILTQKGLLFHALQYLEKAESFCLKYDIRDHLLLEIYVSQIAILRQFAKFSKIREEKEKLAENLSNILNIRNQLTSLRNKIFYLRGKYGIISFNKKQEQEFKNILKNNILHKPIKNDVASEAIRLSILTVGNNFLQNEKAIVSNVKDLSNLAEGLSEEVLKTKKNFYINALIRAIEVELITSNKKVFYEKDNYLKKRIFELYNMDSILDLPNAQLADYRATMLKGCIVFDKQKEFVEKIKEFKRNYFSYDKVLTLNHFLNITPITSLLIEKNYLNEAFDFVVHFLNIPSVRNTPAFEYLLRLYQNIIMFELGNYDFMCNLIQNFKRTKLYKKNKVIVFESFLFFLENLSKSPKAEHKAIFKTFYKTLDNYEMSFTEGAVSSFLLITWLKNKVA